MTVETLEAALSVTFAEWILASDMNAWPDHLPEEWREVDSVQTFKDAGLLTPLKGVVLRMKDGSVFQLAVVRSH